MNEHIKKLILWLKKPKILIVLGFIGIFLIFISSLTSGGEKKEVKTQNETSFSTEQYRDELESSISDMVKKITGSENVSVVITLESGMRYSYADTNEATSESKSESDTESMSAESKQSYITVKTSDGGEDALLVAEMMPEIRGVAIVCERGDDEIIREKVKDAVMAALNITSKRVYVAGGVTYENK